MKKLLFTVLLLQAGLSHAETQEPSKRSVNYDIAEAVVDSLAYALSHFYMHAGIEMYSNSLTIDRWRGQSSEEILLLTGIATVIGRLTQKRIQKLRLVLKEKGKQNLSEILKEVYTGTNIVSGICLPHTLWTNYKKF